jgi:REP element-mobilizing transposase RayT
MSALRGVEPRRVCKIALRGAAIWHGASGRFCARCRLSCHNPAMSRYRRPNIEGGIFFFTVVLADRPSALFVKHIECLRQVYRAVQTRQPFAINAIYILPDHLHAIWTLPSDDADFASRWSQIKSGFSRTAGGAIEVERPDAPARNGNLATTVLGECHPQRC